MSSHFAQIYDLFLFRFGVNLDDTKRGTNSERTIGNLDTQNDRISSGEGSEDFQATRPDSFWSSVCLLSFRHLLIIRRKCIEEMIDDIGCGQDKTNKTTTAYKATHLQTV